MADIDDQYEKQHLRNIAAINKKIKKVYDDAVHKIQVTISTVTYNGKVFNLNDYPALKNRFDSIIEVAQSEIYAAVLNGIDTSWALSNKKNNVIVDKRLIGSRIKKSLVQAWYDSNNSAVQAFKQRVENGLTLSDRVWGTLDSFQPMIEQTVGLGLAVGEPAVEMARKLQQYLIQPDKLFRRVRGEDGQLHLSQAARNYHPGQGVYRSSFQNALRLSATETNTAYRLADHLRWQKMGMVIGQEIKTSNNHPEFDICDELKGDYPKDFIWKGWHSRCLCFKIPKLVDDKQFEKMEDAILAGEPMPKVSGQINKVPAAFNQFLKDNAERIKGWKNTPYWIKDNPEFVNLSKISSS